MFNSVASAVNSQTRPLASSSAESAVEIGLARTQAELMGAFRLLYLSYVRAGFAAENEQQLRSTVFHLLPTTEVFVAKCRGDVVSTMTMVGDGELGLPMESMYAEEIARFRNAGLRVAEMGCFADRRTSPARFKDVFNQLARLVAQVARARDIRVLLAATHPKHARFYVRWLGFEYFGEVKQCPYAAGSPAVALRLDLQAIPNAAAHDRLFGVPVPAEDLLRTQWSPETMDVLQCLVQPSHATAPHIPIPATVPALQSGHPTRHLNEDSVTLDTQHARNCFQEMARRHKRQLR